MRGRAVFAAPGVRYAHLNGETFAAVATPATARPSTAGCVPRRICSTSTATSTARLALDVVAFLRPEMKFNCGGPIAQICQDVIQGRALLTDH